MPNANATVTLMTLLVCWLVGCPTSAAETLRIDFEQGAELAQYQQLDCGALEAAAVRKSIACGFTTPRRRPSAVCG